MDKSKTPLFDLMAADLSSCRPEFQDEVLCPMCLGRFGRSEIRSLTKEHVLSKSLGGSAITLTCKSCNNACGHKIQAHLTTLLKINESLRGEGEVRGTFTLFGETVPVGIQVRPSAGLNITALGGRPRSLECIHEGMKTQAQSKWAMQIKFPYSPGKASAAIARAAYLAAFCRFGYRYILSEPVNILRAEIISAMDTHSARLCVLTGKTKSHAAATGRPPESVIVPIVTETGHRFFVVMLKFRQNRDYWMFCALPTPEQPLASMFTDLAHAVEVIGMCDLKMAGDEDDGITVEFTNRTAAEPDSPSARNC
jgi:hypothetical protein